ncbi:hypothetical protein Taro_039590 [Colocasia esculenta]|uniref:RNase H type-1 domain-containing protein n=1 Tax=Colocasia esculenta TaxID=4460 RepID=A0A843WJB7_COLES|nr:hypothetical protein [Colocasia esculenta]
MAHVVANMDAQARIWIFWEENVHILKMNASDQFITLLVTSAFCKPFYLTVVLASCCVNERRKLWDYIIDHSTACSDPWLIGGDFNNYLGLHEKRGGKKNLSRSVMDFLACVSAEGIEDVGFTGSKFTWFNGREHNGIWIRIDKLFFNAIWAISCPPVHVQHLDRACSDHSPLLISSTTEERKGPSRFTFQHMWCSHDTFTKDSAAAWKMAPASTYPLINMAFKLQNMKKFYRRWNKETFGNVSQNLQQAEASFATAQKNFDDDPSHGNHAIFLLAKDRLDHVLSQEEKLWRQKSRIKWLKDGDNNTKFVHAYALNQKRKSRISKLYKADGTSVEEDDRIAAMFVEHFSKAFSSAPHQSYEESSGQLINKHKSSFYVPNSAIDSLVQKISRTTGFVRTKLPIKYLGISIYNGHQKPAHFANIISKTVSKLQGWKSNFLSSGGRLILIRHTLSALPIYTMNALSIPPTVNIPQPWLNALKQPSKGDADLNWNVMAPRIVRWLTPPQGRLKLNVDGAFNVTTNEAGGGGILRDHKGNMYCAFANCYKDLKSSLIAEALALRDGLLMCCNKGINDVQVETDSLNLLHIVTGQLLRPCDFAFILQEIAAIAKKVQAAIKYVMRNSSERVSKDCCAKDKSSES